MCPLTTLQPCRGISQVDLVRKLIAYITHLSMAGSTRRSDWDLPPLGSTRIVVDATSLTLNMDPTETETCGDLCKSIGVLEKLDEFRVTLSNSNHCM